MSKKRISKRQRHFRRTGWLLKFTFLAALLAVVYAPIARNFEALSSWASRILDEYHYRHMASFGIEIPTRYQVHGIDVSRYQGKIDWEAVAAINSDGIRISFVFIKATEGMQLVDPYFKRNWKATREHGMLRGAYHYFKPHVNGRVQARLFLKTVDFQPGDLLPVVDVEEIGRLSPAELRRRLAQFIEVVEESTGVKPIIYTGLSFYEDYLQGHFETHPFWIAHYYHARPRLKAGLEWHFWQHSDKGTIQGIDHVVDFNVFQGEPEELRKLCFPSADGADDSDGEDGSDTPTGRSAAKKN